MRRFQRKYDRSAIDMMAAVWEAYDGHEQRLNIGKRLVELRCPAKPGMRQMSITHYGANFGGIGRTFYTDDLVFILGRAMI